MLRTMIPRWPARKRDQMADAVVGSSALAMLAILMALSSREARDRRSPSDHRSPESADIGITGWSPRWAAKAAVRDIGAPAGMGPGGVMSLRSRADRLDSCSSARS